MDEQIKNGDLIVTVPIGITSVPLSRIPDSELIPQKPEIPSSLEESVETFSTTDPFQYHLADAKATTNIGNVDKPWVRKTWFFLNVILPAIMMETVSIGSLFSPKEEDRWSIIAFMHIIGLPVIVFSLYLWNKGKRS